MLKLMIEIIRWSAAAQMLSARPNGHELAAYVNGFSVMRNSGIHWERPPKKVPGDPAAD